MACRGETPLTAVRLALSTERAQLPSTSENKEATSHRLHGKAATRKVCEHFISLTTPLGLCFVSRPRRDCMVHTPVLMTPVPSASPGALHPFAARSTSVLSCKSNVEGESALVMYLVSKVGVAGGG